MHKGLSMYDTMREVAHYPAWYVCTLLMYSFQLLRQRLLRNIGPRTNAIASQEVSALGYQINRGADFQ